MPEPILYPNPEPPPPGTGPLDPRFGTLNGHPVGPELPPAVPCEGCGQEVWVAEGTTATQDRTGEVVSTRGVWELDPNPWPVPGLTFTWALRPHACPLAAKAAARPRRGLLTGEALDDDDDPEPDQG